MKNILVFLFIFLTFLNMFCLDYEEEPVNDTVLELQIENELADRIQEFLDPLIGKTLVFVDLELEYPLLEREFYGIEVNKQESLPGLPVAKSTSTTDNFGLENKKDMTRIVSKSINIIMSEKISESKRDEIEELLDRWLKIDESKDIMLIQYRKLKQEAISANYTIILIIMLVIVLFTSLMIKSGFHYLASALKKVKITDFGNILHVKGEVTSPRVTGNAQGLSNLHISQKKPLPIALINNSSEEQDYTDFSFLENLSVNNFLSLIKGEANEDIALILSKIDSAFASKIIEAMKADAKSVIDSLTSDIPRTKKSVKAFRTNLFEKYSKYEEERDYQVDGEDTLISLINNLPAADSTRLYDQIRENSGKVAAQIRNQIFLVEDIMELSDDVVKALLKTLHHDKLVMFLVSNDEKFRIRFFKNMTQRSISIIEEDIEINTDISDIEKVESTNEMLMTIRKILNFI